MSSKKRNSFLIQGMILAGASIVCRIIGLLYRAPLQATIGKEGVGYYGFAYNIYNIILLIASFSIPLAVSKAISARLAKREYVNAQRIFYGALAYAVVVGGIASCVAFFGAPVFVGHQKGATLALQVISPTIFFSGILGVFRGYFQGHNTMIPTSISQIIEQILNAVFSVFMAYILIQPYLPANGTITYNVARYGAAGSAIGTGVGVGTGLLFSLLIYIMYQPKAKALIRRDRTRNIESYSNVIKILLLTITPVIFSTAIYNCSAIIDQTVFSNVLVGKGVGASTVAVFYGVFSNQYNVLINVPVAMASALANSIVPRISGAYATGNHEEVNGSIQLAIRFTMMIAIPCAVGMGVLNSEINGLIFGGGDATGLGPNMLRIGAISIIFYCLSTLTNGILQGMGKMRVPVKHAAVSVVVNIVVLWITLTVFNASTYGLVFATTAFSLVMCILNGRSIKKYTGFHQEISKTFIKPAISAGIMGAIIGGLAFLFMKFLPYGRMGFAICLVITIPIGILVYFAAIIKLKVFSKEELLNVPKGHLLVRLATKLRLL